MLTRFSNILTDFMHIFVARLHYDFFHINDYSCLILFESWINFPDQRSKMNLNLWVTVKCVLQIGIYSSHGFEWIFLCHQSLSFTMDSNMFIGCKSKPFYIYSKQLYQIPHSENNNILYLKMHGPWTPIWIDSHFSRFSFIEKIEWK